jgi:hypothetical protein
MLTTGARDDGLAGLWEIKQLGGKTNDIVGQPVVLQDNAMGSDGENLPRQHLQAKRPC